MKLLKNATIMPLAGSMDSFTGGVYTYDGEFVEGSLLYRGRAAELQKSTKHLSETYIYGGCLFGHFGHFIWESLSRLYAIRQYNDYPIIFIMPENIFFNEQTMFFKSLGIHNEIHIVKIPTSVENLIYFLPGSSINPLFISDEQINSLQYFHCSDDANNNRSAIKVWLSRSNLLFGTILNEQVIETVLAKNGYKIVRPETLPLYEQVSLISTADIVAGFDGSAFFSLLFSKQVRSKFYIFNRRPKIPETIKYVFQRRHVEFELHDFDIEYICGKGAWAYYNHPAPEKIIEILK